MISRFQTVDVKWDRESNKWLASWRDFVTTPMSYHKKHCRSIQQAWDYIDAHNINDSMVETWVCADDNKPRWSIRFTTSEKKTERLYREWFDTLREVREFFGNRCVLIAYGIHDGNKTIGFSVPNPVDGRIRIKPLDRKVIISSDD